jgi:hypothetical protein
MIHHPIMIEDILSWLVEEVSLCRGCSAERALGMIFELILNEVHSVIPVDVGRMTFNGAIPPDVIELQQNEIYSVSSSTSERISAFPLSLARY